MLQFRYDIWLIYLAALAIAASAILAGGCVTSEGKLRSAELLYAEGQDLMSTGKEEAAVSRFEKSLMLSREIGFSAGIAHNLNELAIYHTSHGEFQQARELLAEAIDIYKKEAMAAEVSKAMNNLAITFLKERNFSAALEQYNTLLQWDRQTNNMLGAAITMNNMGLIFERYLARPAEAGKSYQQALEIFKQLGKDEYIRAVTRNLRGLH